MITFETQEDFENAVMAVLRERLEVAAYHKNSSDKLCIELLDCGETLSSSAAYLP